MWTSITYASLFWHQQSDTVFAIFQVPCTVVFTVYFHTVISVFCTNISAFFVIVRSHKQTLLIERFNFVSTKDLSLFSQLDVQAVKAEKAE